MLSLKREALKTLEVVNQLQGVQCARGLDWVDLDFECSTVCPILPGLMGIWQ